MMPMDEVFIGEADIMDRKKRFVSLLSDVHLVNCYFVQNRGGGIFLAHS